MLFMAVFHVNTRLPWAHVEIPFFFFLNTICKIYSKDESSGITFCSQNIHAHSVLDCHLKLSQKKSPPHHSLLFVIYTLYLQVVHLCQGSHL